MIEVVISGWTVVVFLYTLQVKPPAWIAGGVRVIYEIRLRDDSVGVHVIGAALVGTDSDIQDQRGIDWLGPSWVRGLLIHLCLCLIAGGCGETSGNQTLSSADFVQIEDGEVVATVGATNIRAGELRREMLRHGVGLSPAPESLNMIVDRVVRDQLLAEAALAAGFDSDPHVRANYNRLLAEAYLRAQVEENRDELVVSDAEIETSYQENLVKYSKPDRIRLSVIQLPTGKAGTSGSRQLENAREATAASQQPPRTFAEFARSLSTHPSGTRGGDLGWLPVGANTYVLDPEILDAAYTLESVGEMSGPIESRRGWHLVMLTDSEEGAARPIAAVESQIKGELREAKRAELEDRVIGSLRDQFQIEIEDDLVPRLQAIAAATERNRPASFPLAN